jgi:hypothetical protein
MLGIGRARSVQDGSDMHVKKTSVSATVEAGPKNPAMARGES